VEPIAVELDGQPLLRPAAVDPPAAGWAVGFGEWQACVDQELQKAGFEGGEGDLHISVEDPSELLRAWVVGSPRQHGLDRFRRGAVADAGLVAGSGQGING
jgi:hypothetical protein